VKSKDSVNSSILIQQSQILEFYLRVAENTLSVELMRSVACRPVVICKCTYSHAPHNDVPVNNVPHIRQWYEFLENLDKLIVEENYLPEQMFSMDETSVFWKQMPERTFIHKEAKSVPDFRVCVST